MACIERHQIADDGTEIVTYYVWGIRVPKWMHDWMAGRIT